MYASDHDHQHTPNQIWRNPDTGRLNANPEYTGKGVTVAFLDSGFYPHPDLVNQNRLLLITISPESAQFVVY